MHSVAERSGGKLATLTVVNLIANVVQLLSASCCCGAVCHWGQAQIWLKSKMSPVAQISGQKWAEVKTIQSMPRFRGAGGAI